MKLFKSLMLGIISAVTVIAPVESVSAKTPDGFSFRDLEFGHGAADAERLGQGEIHRLIRPGMPAADALNLIHEAGADCRAHQSEVVCHYNGFESVEESLHDLVWTIKLSISNDRVTSILSTRESIGS